MDLNIRDILLIYSFGGNIHPKIPSKSVCILQSIPKGIKLCGVVNCINFLRNSYVAIL